MQAKSIYITFCANKKGVTDASATYVTEIDTIDFSIDELYLSVPYAERYITPQVPSKTINTYISQISTSVINAN